MEQNGYNYINKFVTFKKCRRNCSIDLRTKSVKKSPFLSILYIKLLRELIKANFRIGDKIRISKLNLPFRNGFKPRFTPEVFKIVAFFLKKIYDIHDKV